MPLPSHVIEELRRVVGKDHVIAGAGDLRIFERDASIEGAVPDAVVLPANTQQVSDVVKIAARHRIPVVPRGAGTGLSGGAVTIRGGIALQVTRMRRILEIDPVAQTALVEPGRPTAEIANLLFRRNGSPRLVAEVPARLPAGTLALVGYLVLRRRRSSTLSACVEDPPR